MAAPVTDQPTRPVPPPPHRPSRIVVSAAVLLVVLVCGTGAVQLLSQVATGTVERTSVLTPQAARFVVDSDVGDVALGPSADGQVHVHSVVRYGMGQPELVEQSTSTGVRLDLDCNATRCDVAYEVQVPPGFEVVIGGTAGDVTASGLSGPLTVDREVGDIAVFDVSGPLDLHSSTGEITGESVRSEVVRMTSTRGDVRLDLQVAPRTLDVESTTGEMDLAVPGDVAYRVDARTGSGEERVLVPVDSASPRTISASGETGDLTLRPSR
jgi:hypothetical protein